MSEIANALAKAKERTGHTTAPFLVPGAPQPTIDPARAAAAAAAIQKARRTQRFWFILIALALPATGFLVWSRLSLATPSIPISSGPAPVAGQDPSSQSPSSPDTAVSSSNPAGIANSTASAHTHSPDKPAPAPRPDFISRVSELTVTAVMPGDPPRIVIAGKIIRQGQPLDADLTFSTVANGQIIFTDARGAVYTRRY